MSLEDQIRRMGDARAAEVNTPSEASALHPSRRHLGARIGVAAAAVALVAAGIALFVSLDDEDVTDVAGAPTTTSPVTTSAEAEPPSTTITTTTEPTTTTSAPAQTGICAANPPTGDVPDIATHIAANRTPLDLDLDGVPDEMLIYDDADGTWWLIARLQVGWTNALELDSVVVPELTFTADGSPAAADIDGDGGLEFLVTGPHNPWAGGVRLVVWMEPDASAEQQSQIRDDLDQPTVGSYEFVDQDAALEEFQERFADIPELLDVVTADELPASFRVVPENDDPGSVEQLANQFEGRAGVRDVTTADSSTRRVQGLVEELTEGTGVQIDRNAAVVSLHGCALQLAG